MRAQHVKLNLHLATVSNRFNTNVQFRLEDMSVCLRDEEYSHTAHTYTDTPSRPHAHLTMCTYIDTVQCLLHRFSIEQSLIIIPNACLTHSFGWGPHSIQVNLTWLIHYSALICLPARIYIHTILFQFFLHFAFSHNARVYALLLLFCYFSFLCFVFCSPVWEAFFARDFIFIHIFSFCLEAASIYAYQCVCKCDVKSQTFISFLRMHLPTNIYACLCV